MRCMVPESERGVVRLDERPVRNLSSVPAAPDLRAAAGERDVRLVDLGQLVTDLVPGSQPA
jgi:hypothetical protein